jgi:flagellin
VAGTPTLNSGQTTSTVTAGALIIHSTTGSDLNITGTADFLKQFGLTSATGGGSVTVTAARTTNGASAGPPVVAGTLSTLLQAGSSLNVDGHIINFKDAAVPAGSTLPTGSGIASNIVTDGNGNSAVYLQTATIGAVLNAIDLATGVQTIKGISGAGVATLQSTTGQTNSAVVSGALKLSTGVNADLSITGTGNALSVLRLSGNTGTATAFTAARASGVGGINGKTLTFHLQRRHGSQRHLRRRHQRHGQDAGRAQCGAGGEQSDRGSRRQGQPDDLGLQRLRVLDAGVGSLPAAPSAAPSRAR